MKLVRRIIYNGFWEKQMHNKLTERYNGKSADFYKILNTLKHSNHPAYLNYLILQKISERNAKNKNIEFLVK